MTAETPTAPAADQTITITGRSTRERRSEYDRPETIEETAEALRISPATVKREWSMAKSWLYRELSNNQTT